MTNIEIAQHHLKNNTPLRLLANVVRWHEDLAVKARGDERKAHEQKADSMSAIISAIYAVRESEGQYA